MSNQWTDEDEERFQQEKAAYFADEARKDAERKRDAELGFAPCCPYCGSHRYTETTFVEVCDDCGESQSYW